MLRQHRSRVQEEGKGKENNDGQSEWDEGGKIQMGTEAGNRITMGAVAGEEVK